MVSTQKNVIVTSRLRLFIFFTPGTDSPRFLDNGPSGLKRSVKTLCSCAVTSRTVQDRSGYGVYQKSRAGFWKIYPIISGLWYRYPDISGGCGQNIYIYVLNSQMYVLNRRKHHSIYDILMHRYFQLNNVINYQVQVLNFQKATCKPWCRNIP